MMYGEKLMLAGVGELLDKSHAIAGVFRVRFGGDKPDRNGGCKSNLQING
jgi:hypothetical protein